MPKKKPEAGSPSPAALYERMLLLRRFEETAGRVYTEGKIGGFCHLYIGQEAVSVGVAAALDPAVDYLVNGYRDHGHALAWGTEPGRVLAELYGKATGMTRGKGGSMHLFDAARHNYGGYGIVGGQIPLALGLAFALRYKAEKGVVVCFFGEAAVNNGAFHESLNMAALWKLPVVFICENNRYGMGTSIERSAAITDVWKRGSAHGIRGELVDGMDVRAVQEAMTRAAAECRPPGGMPVLLEARTYRFRGHSMADPGTYRSKDEVDEQRKRDPLALVAAGLARKDLDAIELRVKAQIDLAVQFAEESPFPDPAEIWNDVYASPGDPALVREI
jgi:pyruvate dehydrogenase E1 component alpha subunit